MNYLARVGFFLFWFRVFVLLMHTLSEEKKYNIYSKIAKTIQVFHQPIKGISGHC